MYKPEIEKLSRHQKRFELAARIELLQNKMIAMDQQNDQRRMQLATLQQEFYKRGTTSYSDSEV